MDHYSVGHVKDVHKLKPDYRIVMYPRCIKL